MAMTPTYLNVIAAYGGTLITHIGLVNFSGVEISGGSPAYARRAVVWTAASGGVIRPTIDLVFNVPAGGVVAGWRGYSAAVGGTDYGGADVTLETFAAQKTYRLLSTLTSINHLISS